MNCKTCGKIFQKYLVKETDECYPCCEKKRLKKIKENRAKNAKIIALRKKSMAKLEFIKAF